MRDELLKEMILSIGIEKYLRETKSLWEDKISSPEFIQIGSVVGTHTGPGALFLSYFSKEI